MKTGIVDVGGGLRGIYAAGVLDYCMDQGISFFELLRKNPPTISFLMVGG